MAQELELELRFKTFVGIQLLVITLLIIAGALVYVYAYKTGDDFLYGVLPMFDVGRENSVPTFVSALNLLLAAILSFTLYRTTRFRQEAHTLGWLLLALIFVYLAFDEAASIHEKFKFAKDLFPQSTLVHQRHAWLIPGAILAAVFAIMVIPFVFSLPRRTAVWLVFSGLVFAGGIFGMELLGSWMLKNGVRPNDVIYVARRILEEALEMYGILIYNCVVFAELTKRQAKIRLRFTSVNS